MALNIDDFQPPMVAILRGLTAVEAPGVADVLFACGFRLLEVPLNRPGALECIAIINSRKPANALVGGGTMLTLGDVELVSQHGGGIMIAPNFNVDVVRRAKELGMFAVPGVATPTEALAALAAGADVVKWFPAEALGIGGLRSVKTILPTGARVWPVGGVSAGNLRDWRLAGADGFGVGARLYEPGISLSVLEGRANELIAAWRAG
ncbi:2-dehydro-3-deoxy-6-phosphogalactonate aldolase [Pseudoduganella violaceinigra]|uniref:2-dehydro-3-deoxy-6-phosphogalactonate aldolase n=1 Tax=Pseudoduganella violaceinigra TaxID=246602 RepID=UPI000554209E|nr:2-dehydro-3-deoxy-6-phosphogalactonate aldolase [Pseudoduganella violaceinigra]